MSSKTIELPPEVAKPFVRDMRAFHAEKSPIKRDEIASRQIHVLRQYQGSFLAEGVTLTSRRHERSPTFIIAAIVLNIHKISRSRATTSNQGLNEVVRTIW